MVVEDDGEGGDAERHAAGMTTLSGVGRILAVEGVKEGVRGGGGVREEEKGMRGGRKVLWERVI